MTRGRGGTAGARAGAVVVAGLLAACGGRGDPGDPGPAPAPPDLTGVRVMVLPAQAGAPEQLDRELAHWLGERGPTTSW
ncbi:MAG: hypothetical protein GWM90_27270, partial [Gemmatimonadetes bacterium]|nr:hypothetical protein [Gemmatimonadota bacterium]NIQ58643.1 hypothetical protein [Gemmatimonadota bacterium]NIU78834.1 hypothetical protein [Gammaproteobacteria bacterium]NIX47634.1 hypothetical protein [Gemmatimonadota bacterium]NIY11996.1 hypothetical protein [Gemmatimonadota bacterium]